MGLLEGIELELVVLEDGGADDELDGGADELEEGDVSDELDDDVVSELLLAGLKSLMRLTRPWSLSFTATGSPAVKSDGVNRWSPCVTVRLDA